MKKKALQQAQEYATEHRELSRILEQLLDLGWLDNEKVADYLATQIIENPYGTIPYWKLATNKK